MQLYNHLSILTARPCHQERHPYAHIPYVLDGVLSKNEKASAGWWVKEAAAKVQDCWATGYLPLIVGGTGLYIKSLIEGISPIPDIPKEIREHTRNLRDIPLDILKDHLALKFPEREIYNDPQRLLRAYEVYLASGKTVDHFQKMKKPLIDCRFITIALMPDRKKLYEKINKRFETMMKNGAIDEVKALLQQSIDPDHPILKATGVGAITGYLNNSHSSNDAVTAGQQHTRHYAKRQLTWIRNQLTIDLVLDSYDLSLEEQIEQIMAIL